jgi:hypothetical protein
MTMNKKELQAEFTMVKKGFSNFPALATSSPNANLTDLHIAEYEVAPTEPLHDFKGHMANVIGEVRVITNGSTKDEVENIYLTILKDTVRGVDYRKATILLSNAFEKICTSSEFFCLFNTAVQINEIMYSTETRRCQKTILRFHNLTLQHAICSV